MNKLLGLIIIGLMWSINLYSQSLTKKTPKFYLELRPLQFLMDGYSIVGHYDLNGRNQVGLNIFASTLSSGATDFVWNTTGVIDLEAKQDIVIALSYRYFLNSNKPNRSFFTGASIGGEFYTLTNRENDGRRDYTFYYIAPRVGYMAYPFRKKLPNFFLSLEAVTVIPVIRDEEVEFANGSTAQINNILPVPLLGIGYRF